MPSTNNERILNAIINSQNNFNFASLSKKLYGCSIHYSTLKALYAPEFDRNGRIIRGHATEETSKKGVYALYFDGELKKIGKAADTKGIFHRMGQYYRQDKNGGSIHINSKNRDFITVEYIVCDSAEDCWITERLLQCIAYYKSEKLPWESRK